MNDKRLKTERKDLEDRSQKDLEDRSQKDLEDRSQKTWRIGAEKPAKVFRRLGGDF